MRTIIAFTHATLDGFIDDPHEWWLPYLDDELRADELEMHLAADALLLGRVTFEGMAKAWPAMDGDPFVDHVNAMTHHVVASQPVDTSVWEPTVVIPGADLIDEVRRLEQADDGDILIWGTGRLTDAVVHVYRPTSPA
ncbi:MAG TPA: hypothetical protein VFU19_13925 [Iamia sp.]|nr:hypothetical protein [Iamia sp.]